MSKPNLYCLLPLLPSTHPQPYAHSPAVAHTLLRTPHGPLTLMTALHDNNPKDLASPDLRMWYQVLCETDGARTV